MLIISIEISLFILKCSSETRRKLRNNIICPYCLADDTIDKKKDKKEKNYYSCSECNSTITREYVENTSASVEVVSAVR